MTAIELYFKPQNNHSTDTVCNFNDKSALAQSKWDVIEQALVSTERMGVKKLNSKTDMAFAQMRIKLVRLHDPLYKELYQLFHSNDIINTIIVIGDTPEPMELLNNALTKAS